MNPAHDTDRLPRIGTGWTTHGRTLTETDLVSFSALTGDWHPQHADAEWAAESRFGERIAHGMAVLSYAVGLAAFDPERVVALRGLDRVRFKRPVRIGDTIRATLEVDEVTAAKDEHALVTYALTVTNQRGQAVVRARLGVLWSSGSAPRGERPLAEGDPPDPVPL